MDDRTLNPVDAAIRSRRSVRAFRAKEVPEQTVKQILETAARAPSGTNTQPWRVYVLRGQAKDELSQRILAVYDDPEEAAKHTQEYAYYPTKWVSPYIERRRKIGWDLYGLLGIQRGEKDKMHAQHARNYKFFDAPVGLMFTIDRILEKGSRLRHVSRKHHDRRKGPRPGHLSAGGLDAVSSHHQRIPPDARKRDLDLRHVARLRRQRSRRKHASHRSRTAGDLGDVS